MNWTNGLVASVTDSEIMDAKAIVDSAGIGCEPASAASVAGLRQLQKAGIIKSEETVICILTGNLLKDPAATVDYHTGAWPEAQYANPPTQLEPDMKAVQRELERRL
jgi:threonine synthase